MDAPFDFGKFFLLLFAIPKKQQGVSFGILDSKGEAWIEVREDSGFRNRYLPLARRKPE